MTPMPVPDRNRQVSSTAPADPFDFHQKFVQANSAEDKRLIARIKRLVEWIMADQDFRQGLLAQPERAAELAAERGVEIDPHLVEPIWAQGFKTICPTTDYERWPVMKLWNQWVADILRYRNLLFLAADPGEYHPRFAKWRKRCKDSNDFFLGSRNKAIVYPVFSYELSKGCSVGCWFCAFSAQRLSGVYRHSPENAKLWREILEVGLDIFGLGAAQSGFCYWATEPLDNPDYLEFLKDFRDVTGIVCQTTTAAATRNLDWTRRMLEFYNNEVHSVRPRFSVLSLKMLRDIHQAFTPEELLRVECIPQNAESFLGKAQSGRAAGQNREQWTRERRRRVAESGQGPEKEHEQEATYFGDTTACVSGYLVNMLERTVELVSPCGASQRWPQGYRVHERATFRDAAEYRAFIERTVARHMPESLSPSEPVEFVDGLQMSQEDDALILLSRAKKLRIRPGDHIYAQVARLIHPGGARPDEIMARLMDQGQSPFDITGALDYFFQTGLLEPPTRAPA